MMAISSERQYDGATRLMTKKRPAASIKESLGRNNIASKILTFRKACSGKSVAQQLT
jgi:hypothetical protein